MNIFLSEHQEILRHLLEAGVDFMLIGGYAVIYHGYGRTTGDMDLWIRPTNETRERLIAALRKAGFEDDGLREIQKMDFTRHLVLTIGEEPNKIDFLTFISGVGFEEARAGAVKAELDGMMLSIINLRDLVLSKFSSGRSKDKADIEELQRITAKKNGDTPK